MQDWCIAHPWMTFFLGMAALNVVRILIRGYPPTDGEGD